MAVIVLREGAVVDDLLVDSQVLSKLIHLLQISTRCSGSAYGSGVRSTALTTLKIAEVAPMPRASVKRAATAKPGLFHSLRTAPLTSCRMRIESAGHQREPPLAAG